MREELHITPALRIPESELRFQFSRSGGPGGQNVNKVATRVHLLFDVQGSPSLDERQKQRIVLALGSRIDTYGWLRLTSDESRSQWRNRQIVLEKFVEMLKGALAVRKSRRATKPSGVSREKRFKAKHVRGERKRSRGRVSPDE